MMCMSSVRLMSALIVHLRRFLHPRCCDAPTLRFRNLFVYGMIEFAPSTMTLWPEK